MKCCVSRAEIGATLFAAASGLREPGELRRALNTEADEIFAPRASKTRRFYQALERYDAARRAMRESELRVGDWKELNERIEALRSELGEIDRRRGETMRRARKAATAEAPCSLGAVARRGRRRGSTKSGPVPALPSGLPQRLRAALEAESGAAQRHRECAAIGRGTRGGARRLVDRRGARRAIRRGRVLFAETGRYAKASEDLPGVDREAEAMRAGLETLARRLGLAQSSEIKSRQPSDAELAHLRALCRDGRAIERELGSLDADLARERQGLLQEETGGRRRGAHRPRAFARTPRRRSLRPCDVSSSVPRSSRRSRPRRRSSPRQDTGSRRPSLSLDALAGASLPGLETIGRFRKEHEAFAKIVRARRRRNASGRARVRRASRRSSRKSKAWRAVPSLEAIAAARSERETLWARLRAALFGAELPAANAGLFGRVLRA